MDEKIVELIAIGAAYAGNCEACLAHHIRQASLLGISTEEAMQAVRIAKAVKNATSQRLDDIIESHLSPAASPM